MGSIFLNPFNTIDEVVLALNMLQGIISSASLDVVQNTR
jgi:hypothetical protein